MSVLIKGLEMPTTCTMCWLNTFCGMWNTEPVKHKGFNERLENCPLTELIRCKDCKHRYTECGMGFCEKLDIMFYHYEDQEPIDADFYCKWAERIEE